jgi:hypothetical protein
MSSFNGYGYSTSQMLIEILKRCGDDLTRENIMKVASNLPGIQLDLTLPGLTTGNTTPTNYHLNKQFKMMKFDGERWITFGDIIDASKGSGS